MRHPFIYFCYIKFSKATENSVQVAMISVVLDSPTAWKRELKTFKVLLTGF